MEVVENPEPLLVNELIEGNCQAELEHPTTIQDFKFEELPSPIRRKDGWSEVELNIQPPLPVEGFDAAQGQSVSDNLHNFFINIYFLWTIIYLFSIFINRVTSNP